MWADLKGGPYRSENGHLVVVGAGLQAGPSDRDHPMLTHVERQLVAQPIDERRPVLVQEVYEADGSFLRVAAGERLRLGMSELPPQRFILTLRGLNDLGVQLLEVVLHPAER